MLCKPNKTLALFGLWAPSWGLSGQGRRKGLQSLGGDQTWVCDMCQEESWGPYSRWGLNPTSLAQVSCTIKSKTQNHQGDRTRVKAPRITCTQKYWVLWMISGAQRMHWPGVDRSVREELLRASVGGLWASYTIHSVCLRQDKITRANHLVLGELFKKFYKWTPSILPLLCD